MIDLSYPIKRPYNIICLIKKQLKILFQSIPYLYYTVNYRPSSERFIRIFENVRRIFTCDRKRKCLSDSFSHRNKVSTVYGAILLSLIVAQQLSFPLHCDLIYTSASQLRRSVPQKRKEREDRRHRQYGLVDLLHLHSINSLLQTSFIKCLYVDCFITQVCQIDSFKRETYCRFC